MMEEQKFWELIEKTLGYSTLENDFAYEAHLSEQLELKSTKELAGFQLQLLELRKRLDLFHVTKTAAELGYNSSRETFERFCNGIVASGRDFYYRIKDEPGYIAELLKREPDKLRQCYYEGFSLLAQNAFHEKQGYDADWIGALKKQQRASELEKNRSQGLDLNLEH